MGLDPLLGGLLALGILLAGVVLILQAANSRALTRLSVRFTDLTVAHTQQAALLKELLILQREAHRSTIIQDYRKEIIALLVHHNFYSERAGRDTLVNDLPEALKALIRRSDTTQIDVTQIVNSAAGWHTNQAAVITILDNAIGVLNSSETGQSLQRIRADLIRLRGY